MKISRKNKKDLSLAERYELYKLHSEGHGIREIAKIIKRAPSTVSEELRRRSFHRYWHLLPWHKKAELSHEQAKKRRTGKRRRLSDLKNEKVRQYVIENLENKLSPKSISFKIGKDLPGESISHETIYQYIYRVDRTLLKYLVRYGKLKRNKRGSKKSSRQKKAELIKRRINIRPQEANKRNKIGHNESDFIVSARGGRSCLMVFVDRSNRHIKLRKLPNREADTTRKAMFSILQTLPPQARKTLTIDNDTAHNNLPMLEKVFRDDEFKLFWCNPYRSWERGTVEAINGILRRWFPKGTNFDDVSDGKVRYVEEWFNTRPMEVLNGKTPNEVFEEQLRLAA